MIRTCLLDRRGAYTSQWYTGPGGWSELSTLPSFLELLENTVNATKMIILFPNQWLHHQHASHQLLGESAWNFQVMAPGGRPSQPSMQPMPQTAVLPPGGTMPQMMQTLICRLARTKIQVEEGWSLEVSSGKTLLILHFGGIRRIVMSDSNRQVVKRAAGS